MPARTVFLDTNGWLALLNSSDALHATARSRWADLVGQGSFILLTDWIVAETGNGLARTRAKIRFAMAVELIRSSPNARLLTVTPTLLERALSLYTDREDKTWGLVDCASFLVMQEEAAVDVFSNDRHFEQAGFKCLLPPA